MDVNVLLTTVGGKVSPSVVKSLTEVEERDLTVVGTDPVETVPGKYMVDEFYRTAASFEDADGFLDDVMDIIAAEDIDLVIPCINEESLLLSEHRERVESAGARLATPNHETLKRAFDKYEAYSVLAECAPEAAPSFHLVTSYDEFETAAAELGFPDEKIVLKPRHGRGGRGVLIIDPEMAFDELLSQKPDRRYPPAFVDQLLKGFDWDDDFLLMEHLPGDIYSTYALCDEGETLLTMTHQRLWGTASQTLKSNITARDDIEHAVEQINAEFGFSYNINYEFKENEDGQAVMFDLNPRIAASTAVFRAVGVNMPYLSVKLALGESVDPEPTDRDVSMMRYYQELFLDCETDELFDPT